eukprot:588007-Amphidinium_carterae.2
MLKGEEYVESHPIRVNRAVGHREGRRFRDEVYAEGKVHKHLPLGRVIEYLGLTLLWTAH